MQRIPLSARLLRQRLLALLDALPTAAGGDVDAVHRARVASRRLREVLPILAEAGHSDALDRAGKKVRRITRALGPVREVDVALDHLDEVGGGEGVSAAALAHVRTYLSAERQRRRQAVLGVLTPASINRLKAQLHDLPGAVTSDHAAELRIARRRAARRARALRAEIHRTGALYVSDRLHAVRIAAKKLRYALEVQRELSRSRAVARIARLKRLQDTLGRIHDDEILAEHIRQVQTALAGTNRRTSDELGILVRALEDACRNQHATFLRTRDAIVVLCDEVIQAAHDGEPAFTI